MARFYELFAGAGLVREALEPLGWECVYANDFDPKKRAVYSARFQDCEDFDLRDLWDVDTAELPRPVDLIAASFPCIDLSLAGKRGGLGGEHSGAFWAFVRVLEELKKAGDEPRCLMIENVSGFLSSNGGEDLRMALRALGDLGYRLDVSEVTAERFTPQSRPRVFVLGLREDIAGEVMTLPESLDFREWAHAANAGQDVRPFKVRRMMLEGANVAQASLIEDESGGEELRWGVVPFPEPPRRDRDLADIIDWTETSWWEPERTRRALSEMAPLHLAKIEAMAESGERRAATAYRRRRNGYSVYEIRSDGVAGCLRTARGGSSTQIVVAVQGEEVRMRWMSPREYARLQGAEYQEALDSFSDADLRTAFGDAVCVPAVRWVAEHAFGPIRALADSEEHSPRGAEGCKT